VRKEDKKIFLIYKAKIKIMAWSDVQKTTVSFRGFLGIFILTILLLGAFNWMFVLLAGLRNPYYTEMDGTDNAKKLKGQDSFEVTQPVAKDMLHFLGKRMSKGLRTTDQAQLTRYNSLQAAKKAGGASKHLSEHDALKGLTILQFVVYLLVFLAFLWFFLALIVTKTTKLGAKLGIETK